MLYAGLHALIDFLSSRQAQRIPPDNRMYTLLTGAEEMRCGPPDCIRMIGVNFVHGVTFVFFFVKMFEIVSFIDIHNSFSTFYFVCHIYIYLFNLLLSFVCYIVKTKQIFNQNKIRGRSFSQRR